MSDCPTLAIRRPLTLDPATLVRALCEEELPLIERAVMRYTKREVLAVIHDLKGRLMNTRVALALAVPPPPELEPGPERGSIHDW